MGAFDRLNDLQISSKLFLLILVLSVIPLIIVGYIAVWNARGIAMNAVEGSTKMGERDLAAAKELGRAAVNDSVEALDAKAIEALEMRAVELARSIANFLYERDGDILGARSLDRRPETYRAFLLSKRHIVNLGHQRQEVPLYSEMTFIDLTGREIIRVHKDDIQVVLRNVANTADTYLGVEDYFEHAKVLGEDEIHVSHLVGQRIDPYRAYRGVERPNGDRFDGIIRWVTPVYEDDEKVGYVTLALNHTHLIEFIEHVVPTTKRFIDIPDPGAGSFVLMWDDQWHNIVNPRHDRIWGYTKEGIEGQEWANTTIEGLLSYPTNCEVLGTHLPSCSQWRPENADAGLVSFTFMWIGEDLVTTFATIPYFSGPYSAPQGFGTLTMISDSASFHAAAERTRWMIDETTRRQSERIRETVELTIDTIDQRARVTTVLLVFVAIASALLVATVGAGMSITLTEPLMTLTDSAERISDGDLELELDVQRGDEIGQLGRAFSRMSQELRKTLDNLRTANLELKELDQLKSQFVSVASHELRTPIISIRGYIELVREGEGGPVTDEQENMLAVASRNTERLLTIINDLLDISRIEAGALHLDMVSVDINRLVRDTLEEIRPLADRHGHTMKLELDSSIPEVEGDPDRLAQIVTNLLSNAIKYTPDKGRIVVRTERGDTDGIHLKVEDDGIGIPSGDLPHIWERFYRGQHASGHHRPRSMDFRTGGTGLGLPIVKGIVEEHGGKVRVESEEGAGSTFHVNLPTETAMIAATGHSSRNRNPMVLVIDDDEEFCDQIELVLRKDFKVVKATSGKEGVDMAGKHRPDLILLDILMSGLDGYEVCRALKESDDTKNIPVIILSSMDREDVWARAEDAGADDFISKTFKRKELLEKVRSRL
ncbi:MAG: ATP-binding protein [Candidatus Undinarchaeales archaeon]|nr:ATP-binding protein [Candidatus Undinarchaeales archaeon]MDP7493159.1 ATP-binding protein [Candidatus Undinarchaeales archaeon]